MFHSPWMYGERNFRSRSSKPIVETNRQSLTDTVHGAASGGSMNDHSGQGNEASRSLTRDLGDDKSSHVNAAGSSSQLRRTGAFRTTESKGNSSTSHGNEDCNRTVSESVGRTEKLSHLSEPYCAVLAVDPIHVTDTDGSISKNTEIVTSSQGHESDAGTLDSSVNSSLPTCHVEKPNNFQSGITTTSSPLTCTGVGEGESCSGIAQSDNPAGPESHEGGDAMGNTHWSHSYTGVRQPVFMRSSCRTNAVLIEDLNDIYVPIIGYEMMEQRARFTVFKLHVQKNTKESWFIFRRYTDFVRLNDQLQYLFPNFRLALPPKKWFGNNFDPMFLEDRQLGLQAFLNNICGHKDIVVSDCVREFLCIDDPPGPHDSLEESRALCESLEETIYNLKKDLAEKDRKIETLTEELAHATRRIEELGIQQIISRPTDRVLPVSSSESETTDMDRRSCAEADQQDYSPEQEERPIVTSYTDEKLVPAPKEVEGDGLPVFTAIPLDNPVSNKVGAIISQSDVIEVT